MGSIAGEFGPTPNANAVAQFEYQFDMNDNDTSADNGMGWTKSVNPDNSDSKMVEAAPGCKPTTERQAGLCPRIRERNAAWNAATFRRLNDAAPSVAFGFESMPGSQKSANRGDYASTSVGGGTYGGCGIYAAKVGGLWDSFLAKAGSFGFLLAQIRGMFPPTISTPANTRKTYTYVTNDADPQAIVNGLRSANSFVVEGDLIDALDSRWPARLWAAPS